MRLGKLHLIATVMILVPLIVSSIIPSAFASETYSYSETCNVKNEGSAGTYWNWTQDGVLIGGSSVPCGGFGSGTVPSTANGIIATLNVQTHGCFHSYTTTKAFSPGSVPKISLNGSCGGINYWTQVSVKASFKLG